MEEACHWLRALRFQKTMPLSVSFLSASWLLFQHVSSQRLVQFDVCLPTAMLSPMMAMDPTTLWHCELRLNAFLYELFWSRCPPQQIKGNSDGTFLSNRKQSHHCSVRLTGVIWKFGLKRQQEGTIPAWMHCGSWTRWLSVMELCPFGRGGTAVWRCACHRSASM